MILRTTRFRPIVLAILIILSTLVGTVPFTRRAAADASQIDIGAGNGTQVTVEAGPEAKLTDISTYDDDSTRDEFIIWVDVDEDGVWDLTEPNTNQTGGDGSSVYLPRFFVSNLSADTYDVAAAEVNSISAGVSADKRIEDQLKIVSGAAPQLQSAVAYDNGTAAEVELAFDENVSAVRTLDVSAADGDTNLARSVSVAEGRVVATLDGVRTGDLEVTYDVVDEAGNAYATNRTAAVRFAPVTTTVGDDDTVYEGATVAVLTNATAAGVRVEAAADDSYSESGSTGANSKVYLLDTGAVDTGEYEVVYGGDESRNATVESSALGLAVGVDDATVTNDDGAAVAGTVSADAGGRTVAVELRDADGNAISTDTAALDGEGEYEFEFDASALAAGDYAVVATGELSGATARSGAIVVSSPSDHEEEDDTDYSDYHDPTETTTAQTAPQRRTPVDATPVADPSGGAAAPGGETLAGEAAETAVGTDTIPATTAETVVGTTPAATDASTPVATESGARPESGTDAVTGTGVPGFGVGAAVAAFVGSALAALAVRRDR